jgi:hypothetical protein
MWPTRKTDRRRTSSAALGDVSANANANASVSVEGDEGGETGKVSLMHCCWS